jgi:hypothetical protein
MNRLRKVWVISAAALFIAGSMGFSAVVAADTVYNVDRIGVAIKGYDPVAFFTEKMPVKGSDTHELEWEEAKW